MNILLSSTQVWNPGDDFIRFGVVAILEAALGETPLHTAIYDRSPCVAQASSGRDNTQANIHCTSDSYAGYDAVVVAGRPAWGKDNDTLYRHALELGLPLYLLGLGGVSIEHFQKTVTPVTLQALHAAKVVTVRDKLTSDYLCSLKVPHHLLPCPACLASLALGPDLPPPDRRLAIIASDVPHIRADALAIFHMHRGAAEREGLPPPHLISHSSHERSRFADSTTPSLYEHDPYRLLRLLLRYKEVHSARLHGALPVIGAGGGRQATLIHHGCPRISGGYETAARWYALGKTSPDLLQAYLQLLHF